MHSTRAINSERMIYLVVGNVDSTLDSKTGALGCDTGTLSTGKW